MKAVILSLGLCCMSLLSISQQVSNVRFDQIEKKIIISYDLIDPESSPYKIELFCSDDNGKTWGNPLNYVTGDVGDNIVPGNGKRIIWDVITERQNLTTEVQFKVVGTALPGIRMKGRPDIEYVIIPGGSFLMGSLYSVTERLQDEIRHNVTISTFIMSKYEITFAQYDAFCDATGRIKPDDQGWGRDKRPVVNISWNDATAFASWVGGRLPTEAEWEYACRAGIDAPFNTGDCITTTQANFNGTKSYAACKAGKALNKTLPVGSFSPNKFGLYDMHGNVWEWCSDWYGEYSQFAVINPKGPLQGTIRVRRGGSWYSYASTCRSTLRGYFYPQDTDPALGFRVVFEK